jgi:heme/copper-type cytochrome/quinol oxidase subunit 2
MQSFRNILRWVFLLLALLFIAWTAPELAHNFREWRAAIHGDPVAARFWRSAFYLDLTDIIVALVVGLAFWFVWKPRKRAARTAQL